MTSRAPFLRVIALAAASLIPLSSAVADPSADQVVGEMNRVADWQIANPSKHAITAWTQAPFFLGLFNLYQVTGDQKYLDALEGFAETTAYGPGPRLTHADDHAVLQAWLELASLTGDDNKAKPSAEHFDKLIAALAKKKPKSVTGGTFTWCWCDALFMSPAVWVQLSKITGDPSYTEFADKEWWTCTDVLYDPDACLYYRDNNFFTKKTPSGRKVFWSRGNGWVIGGLVHVLNYLPADHPSRQKYLALYHDMMAALLKLQNPDGLWRTSLLDPEDPQGESSGSSFFVYGMAWGVNRALLPAETYRPAIMKGWQALAKNIRPGGMLGFVQKIGDQPGAAGPESTEVYGSGAFLLAGSEIVRMLDPSKQRKGLASFQGVTLPERFLREKPRVHARFVPERKDDFAWENDLIAFRAYGPALRDGDENGGFDPWLKRVPYPVMDKWYIEDVTKVPYGNVAKSYHQDQGEGSDSYKVGDTRGCGGISLWLDGKIANLETFTAHRLIENTPEKATFELDYTDTLPDGRVLRETKHITVLLGKRLIQCDSKFTIDGKAAVFNVAIGLKHQTPKAKLSTDAATGRMALWETVDGLGLGTGVLVDPAQKLKFIEKSGTGPSVQSLCITQTDADGHIRWFTGYGWEGQGEITTAAAWLKYLDTFPRTPFATPSFETHKAAP